MKKPENLSELNQAPYNAKIRKITKKAERGLKNSMSEYGDLSGIVYNLRTDRLISGHQRVKQLTALGARMTDAGIELPGVCVFPVRYVDWSEEKELGANITANNQMIAGEFTDDLQDVLAKVLADDEALFRRVGLDQLLETPPSEEELDTSEQLDKLKYTVAVDCDSEEEQGVLATELESRGYKCRLLIT